MPPIRRRAAAHDNGVEKVQRVQQVRLRCCVAGVGLALVALFARSASGQILPRAVPAPPQSGFLTRSDFSFTLGLLGSDDPRFTGVGRAKGDIDALDFGSGRANFTFDYEGVLGGEHHAFELNHGNYFLESSLSRRFGDLEAAFVFHHVSRHLTDREEDGSISWNVFGGRAIGRWAAATWTIDGQVDLGYVYQPHFVDYTWVSALGVALRRPMNGRAAAFLGARGELNKVTGEVRDHGPCGARIEGGIKLRGVKSDVEIYGAYERRIDAYPTERTRVRFAEFGIRLFS
jgi:hypothetical protein